MLYDKYNTPYYENIQFDLVTGTTNYDLDVNESEFLAVFNQDTTVGLGTFPNYVHIRTNNTITVRVNGTGEDGIEITSTDSPFELRGLEIRNLFITNSSGSTAAIRLLFQLRP